jgi:hypothetical protein
LEVSAVENTDAAALVSTSRHDTSAHSSRLLTAWHALTGLLGAVAGLAPHLLHHAGLLLGTALVTGAAGTTLFGVLGLLASVPLLLRLYRRFHTWRAPALGLVVFTALFALSAFVIGPAINGDQPASAPTTPGVSHLEHHG